jgi:hypothetical protein
MVGLPVDARDNVVANVLSDLIIGSHEIWSIRSEYNIKGLMESYIKVLANGREIDAKVLNEEGKLIMPIIRADNYQNINCTSTRRTIDCHPENDKIQVNSLVDLLNELYKVYFVGTPSEDINTAILKAKVTGIVVMEFTDEWWRSVLASIGRDIEGCPNANPYSHTSCGILLGKNGSSLSLAYTGLHKLIDYPLQYCIREKEAVWVVKEFFNRTWAQPENATLHTNCSIVPIFPISYLLMKFSGTTLDNPFLSYLILIILMLIPTITLLILPCPCFCHPYDSKGNAPPKINSNSTPPPAPGGHGH